MLQSRIKQLEDLLTGERKDLLRSSVFLSRIRKVRSEIHLTNSRTWYQTKARNISQIFGSFCQLNSRYGLFKRFQFPAKKPRKNTAPKIRMRQFLKKYMFAQVISLLSINLISINLLSSCDITIYLLMKSQ